MHVAIQEPSEKLGRFSPYFETFFRVFHSLFRGTGKLQVWGLDHYGSQPFSNYYDC